MYVLSILCRVVTLYSFTAGKSSCCLSRQVDVLAEHVKFSKVLMYFFFIIFTIISVQRMSE